MRWLLYYGSRLLSIILFRLLTHWRVRGRDNVPGEGSVLVVANHMNLADIPLIAVSLGRKTMFMAKKELFRSGLSSYLYHRLGSFPVHRGQLDRKALRQARQMLADGWALVIFPEGTRSPNAQLQFAFPGAALVALRTAVPILPIGITGTEKIKGVAWMWHRHQITVNIGCPFYPPSVNSRLTKTELAELTKLIMQHIAELLPLEYQGKYA